MKITTADIEAMLEASPGSTPESLAHGFERRAERVDLKARAGQSITEEKDYAMARALRAYAAESARCASPESTAESLADGFIQRARRVGLTLFDDMSDHDRLMARRQCASDLAMASALRAYAAELNRLLTNAQRAGDNATARAIVQACEVLGLETIGGAL